MTSGDLIERHLFEEVQGDDFPVGQAQQGKGRVDSLGWSTAGVQSDSAIPSGSASRSTRDWCKRS